MYFLGSNSKNVYFVGENASLSWRFAPEEYGNPDCTQCSMNAGVGCANIDSFLCYRGTLSIHEEPRCFLCEEEFCLPCLDALVFSPNWSPFVVKYIHKRSFAIFEMIVSIIWLLEHWEDQRENYENELTPIEFNYLNNGWSNLLEMTPQLSLYSRFCPTCVEKKRGCSRDGIFLCAWTRNRLVFDYESDAEE